jgi:hypothetical protein
LMGVEIDLRAGDCACKTLRAVRGKPSGQVVRKIFCLMVSRPQNV